MRQATVTVDVSSAVAVHGLVKRYPNVTANAVDGISFEVRPREVFGLLGPNGAGKTTTIGVLTTRLQPTAGAAQVSGVDVVRHPVQARAVLAAVPQRANLDRALSVRKNLLFHAAYHGVPGRIARQRADTLLDEFGLARRAGDKVDRLSGGQAQRVMVARALMHDPRVLFLDEPTVGLDPAARLFVWDRIRTLQTRGTSIVLTTHDMHEAAELATRVGIIDHGRLLVLGTPKELTEALPGSQTLDLTVEPGAANLVALVDQLTALDGVERVERVRSTGPSDGANGGSMPPWMQRILAARSDTPAAGDHEAAEHGPLRIRLYVCGDAPARFLPVARLLDTYQATLRDVRIGQPSLEDVFIHYTGRALR